MMQLLTDLFQTNTIKVKTSNVLKRSVCIDRASQIKHFSINKQLLHLNKISSQTYGLRCLASAFIKTEMSWQIILEAHRAYHLAALFMLKKREIILFQLGCFMSEVLRVSIIRCQRYTSPRASSPSPPT